MEDAPSLPDPLSSFGLGGRVAVVTGGSSGLGARFAHVLASAGASVVVTARRGARLQSVASSIPGSVAVVADVSLESDVLRLASEVDARFGRVDVLVNNAGTVDAGPAEDEPLEHFSRAVEINLLAAFRLSQVFGRRMLERGAGSIVNICSILSFASAGGIPQAGYAASKGGLVSLSRELATQWGRRGVRVNALCPGWFRTEMTEDMFNDEKGVAWIRRNTIFGRAGHAHELDGALLWLASDASSYVTGQAIVVDGGFTAM